MWSDRDVARTAWRGAAARSPKEPSLNLLSIDDLTDHLEEQYERKGGCDCDTQFKRFE